MSKTAKTTKTSKRQPGSPLMEAFMNLAESYNSVLDNDPRRAIEEDLDTGHEKPSRKDRSFAYAYSRIAQLAYDQMYAGNVGKDGTPYSSAAERLTNAKRRQVAVVQSNFNPHLSHEENGEALRHNTDYIVARWYVDAAQAKIDAFYELMISAASAYYFLTGEEWKPYARRENGKVNSTLTEDDIAAAMASAEKADAKARSLASR